MRIRPSIRGVSSLRLMHLLYPDKLYSRTNILLPIK
jgi:hypothetical protein